MPRSSGAEPWLAGNPQAPPEGGSAVGVSAGGAVTTIMKGVDVGCGAGSGEGSGSGAVVTTMITGVLVGASTGGSDVTGVCVGGTMVEVGEAPETGVSSMAAGPCVGVSSTASAVAVASVGTSVGFGVEVGGGVEVAVGRGVRASSRTRLANAGAPAMTPV